MEREEFDAVSAEQGWTARTEVDVLMRYIENQNSPEAFRDFLAEQRETENGTTA